MGFCTDDDKPVRFRQTGMKSGISLTMLTTSAREPLQDMKKAVVRKTLRRTLIVACLTIGACDSADKSAQSNEAQRPLPFDRAEISDITPMLDGAAYAKSSDARLWYLRGNKAVQVKALGNASQKLPQFLEVTPVLDGGAYVTSLQPESGLWFLHAEYAEKVSEVPSLAELLVPQRISDKAFYALYLSEHKKRKEAEYRAENPEPPETPDEDSGSYP